jgi:hypothetical protein
MHTPDMRHAARECVSRARELLARGDEPSARHACLELRFAIEYITYEQLQAYMREVSNDALKKWTPKQVISEMLEVDPHADQSRTIAFGLEHTYGVPPPPEEFHLLGQDRRFSMKWANRNHNALGNFLHAPTMHQIESGGAPTAAAITEKATEVANECELILNSPVFNVNFGQFFEFECKDCSTQIRRRAGSFTPEQGVVCPKCRAAYNVESAEGGEVRFYLRKSKYTCRACGAENWVGTHRVAHGAILECEKCGRKATIEQRFVLVVKDDAQRPSGDESPGPTQ